MTDSKEDGHIEADVRELLETLNEWFGQRERGEPTTNSEAAMFREVHGRLNLLDSFTTKKADALSASSPPVGGSGEVDIDVDELAGEIRYVDGEHKLGAGALAEALAPYLRLVIRSALVAPVPNGVPEGWCDMSTAPTDGTHILVRFDGTSSPPTVAHWFGPPPLPGLRAGGWYLSVQQFEGPQIHPTLWMPVPEDHLAASPVTPEGLSGGEETIRARVKPEIIAALREWAEFEQDGGNVEQGAAIDAILDWYDTATNTA